MWNRLTELLDVFRLVLPSRNILPRVQDLHVNHHMSYRDALIVAACLESGVHTLYSEDVPGRE